MATPALGPEGVLAVPDGADSAELRDRLDLALRYIANWYKAVDGSDNENAWNTKIDVVRRKVTEAFKAMDPEDLFPGNTDLALYNEASLAFPAMWRELTFSADTLPNPSLLDQLGSLLDAAVEFPSYIIPKVGDSIARGIGGALGKILGELWPYLALGGAVVGGYFIVKSRIIAKVLP